MIPPLQDLVAALSPALSLEEVISHVGEPPKDPRFRALSVAGYPDTGEPYTVTLELAAPLALSAVADAFGPYQQARTDRGRPRQLVFAAMRPGGST